MTRPVRWISSNVLFVMATAPKRWLCLGRECRPQIWFGRHITRVLEEMNELRMDIYGLQYLLDCHDRELQGLRQRLSDGRRELSRARGAIWAARAAQGPRLVDSPAGDGPAGTAVDEVLSALNAVEDALRGLAVDPDLDTCIF